MAKCALPADHRVETHHELCLALGGDLTSFTGDLLRLIQKADPGNRARLGTAFPRHVAAFEIWQAWPHDRAPLTVGPLNEFLDRVAGAR